MVVAAAPRCGRIFLLGSEVLFGRRKKEERPINHPSHQKIEIPGIECLLACWCADSCLFCGVWISLVRGRWWQRKMRQVGESVSSPCVCKPSKHLLLLLLFPPLRPLILLLFPNSPTLSPTSLFSILPTFLLKLAQRGSISTPILWLLSEAPRDAADGALLPGGSSSSRHLLFTLPEAHLSILPLLGTLSVVLLLLLLLVRLLLPLTITHHSDLRSRYHKGGDRGNPEEEVEEAEDRGRVLQVKGWGRRWNKGAEQQSIQGEEEGSIRDRKEERWQQRSDPISSIPSPC